MKEFIAYCYDIIIKKQKRCSWVKTVITIESDEFICKDFKEELSTLLTKYICDKNK